MDFELSEEQRAIIDAVESLLERHAGPERAIALAAGGDYDFELDRALAGAGFTEIALGEGTGPLEAALLVESVSRAGGCCAFAAGALVAPMVTGRSLAGPVVLALADRSVPVRFAGYGATALVLDDAKARVVEIEKGSIEPVTSNFGYPMGRIDTDVLKKGEALGAGSGERLRAWWRVALAAEAVGAMRSALDVTTAYLKDRRQFGRAIASFQAVQHRLAECAVLIEGARWLAYEAAWLGAPAEAASVAAAHALSTAGRVFIETHQLSGAIGFTHEHDLHVWTMRLQALRLELEGVGAQRRAVAEARWG